MTNQKIMSKINIPILVSDPKKLKDEKRNGKPPEENWIIATRYVTITLKTKIITKDFLLINLTISHLPPPQQLLNPTSTTFPLWCNN